MNMAKTDHVTFNAHFDTSREQIGAWAEACGVSKTEWYHIGAIMLALLPQEDQKRLVGAYVLARRNKERDLFNAMNAVKLALLEIEARNRQSNQSKVEANPPKSILADAAEPVLAQKKRSGKAAG